MCGKSVKDLCLNKDFMYPLIDNYVYTLLLTALQCSSKQNGLASKILPFQSIKSQKMRIMIAFDYLFKSMVNLFLAYVSFLLIIEPFFHVLMFWMVYICHNS